jgi:hypothetical protein
MPIGINTGDCSFFENMRGNEMPAKKAMAPVLRVDTYIALRAE